MASKRNTREHFLGCLLGGAVGDALGAAIEFDSLAQIRHKHGSEGLRDYAPAYGRQGAITDDTQMTLFTAEALIRAHNRQFQRGICSVRDVAQHAYLRWLHTQGTPYSGSMMQEGWLVNERGLHARRAPGNSCLSALAASKDGAADMGTTGSAVNDSKGCGGVMRMAPAGLSTGIDPFQTGCDLAAITHGHPTGYIAAGCFAEIIQALAQGASLERAVRRGMERLQGQDAAETRRALERALALDGNSNASAEDVERLGQGWIAEEALAIGVYCALVARDYAHGVLLAVNHGGDSDSTGSITGNILGLIHGEAGIPRTWLDRLELRDVIVQVATDLWVHFGEGEKPEQEDPACFDVLPDLDRYPGN